MRQLLCYMHHTKNGRDIQVWQPRERGWVEFRGSPYTCWRDDIPCQAQIFHDGLEGWHTSVLHSGDVLLLHEGHSDFDFAWNMYLNV